MPRRIRTSRRHLLVFLAVAALLLVACGDSGDGGDRGDDALDNGGTTGDAATSAAGGTTELCAQWSAVYEPGVAEDGLGAEFVAELERVAPPSMADDVADFVESERLDREARAAGDDMHDLEGEDLAAVARVMGWVESECAGGVRIAPPLDAVPAGLEVCAARAFPLGLMEQIDEGRIVVYAPADAEDPYAGPVLTLRWGGGSHAGDGDTTPVTLRTAQGATDAVVAPITVAQGAVVPEIGTVVAWSEGDLGFGLYGRGWPIERSDELVTIAEEMRLADDRGDEPAYEIPDAALPTGFTEVFTGPAAAASPMALGVYTVTFHSPMDDVGSTGSGSDDGAGESEPGVVVNLNGVPSEPGAEELWRVYALESERIEVDGRTIAITDRAWGEDGPVMASWRTGDGHVTVSGFGLEREVVVELATASRELSDEEWIELSSLNQMC